MMIVDIKLVARICHETVRACSEVFGGSVPSWDRAPDWQIRETINAVERHWFELQDDKALMPWKAHEAWVAERRANGWKYGAEKNLEKKEHPSMVPWEQLPPSEQVKDYIFVAIVKTFFEARTGG